jgi:hypothetical protein
MNQCFGLWGRDKALRNALADLPLHPLPCAPALCYSPATLASMWAARNEPAAGAVQKAIALGSHGAGIADPQEAS